MRSLHTETREEPLFTETRDSLCSNKDPAQPRLKKPKRWEGLDISPSRDFGLGCFNLKLGLPWWLSGKESTCYAGTAGDMDLIPGSGRSPAGGHGNPLQYS